ncbi:RagB/SusD family nutrient uptake outer membrane protein [Chryseotalea sanaruensis]|uniref:RagB/SusD family nutrient uptake outer membrane protein n=2 Tax=Chryseotalea sanaruensis TaxID=2482724 RepID=A0A401U9Q6_9BACT|nr:RagB/SusD family nutrient uptake outer membrane protein [Chryseotalea sanaruensis]
MHMKYIFRTCIILIALTCSSCADFLEEELEGTYSNENFYKTEEHALLAITGVYNIASFTSTNNALWVFGDVVSDDAVKGGGAGDQNDIQFLDEFNYSRNNGFLEKIWKHYYEGITRANYLLYYAGGIQMDASRKASVIAEAKFLRAYFYFQLVNIFGEVPLKLTPPINLDAINVGKSSVASIYDQIETDLTDATPALESVSTFGIGRATKGAALGLLAKAHLYQGEWELTLDAISDLDALGLYALEPVYKNNFIDSTQNNTESIFEIQHLSGSTPKLGSHLNQWFGSPAENGYYFNVPLQSFVDEFEVTLGGVADPRLDYTVGRENTKWINGEDFSPLWSPTGYLQKKHLQPTREEPIIGDASLNYVYLRYADILLMKAEALNELNRTTEALDPLNEVRKRARESYLYDEGLDGFGVIPINLLPDVSGTQTQVRESIRHERRVELGFEFHRYFDLMRYGQAIAEAALSSTGFSYADDRYFLIPQSEIDTNTAIDE